MYTSIREGVYEGMYLNSIGKTTKGILNKGGFRLKDEHTGLSVAAQMTAESRIGGNYERPQRGSDET